MFPTYHSVSFSLFQLTCYQNQRLPTNILGERDFFMSAHFYQKNTAVRKLSSTGNNTWATPPCWYVPSPALTVPISTAYATVNLEVPSGSALRPPAWPVRTRLRFLQSTSGPEQAHQDELDVLILLCSSLKKPGQKIDNRRLVKPYDKCRGCSSSKSRTTSPAMLKTIVPSR